METGMNERTETELKIISGMADEMLRLGEGCTESDLCARYTRAQIKEYGEEARMLANQRAEAIAA
jgi:hypothetical protein